MPTLKKWIEQERNGEEIIAIVFGKNHSWWDEDEEKSKLQIPYGKVLSYEEAEPFLNYEFDNGYGGEECHPIFAWTATRIFLIKCYDGATALEAIPRHPCECNPFFIGGG
jgi:hypothetical protein